MRRLFGATVCRAASLSSDGLFHWHAAAQGFVNGDQRCRASGLAGGESILRFEQGTFGVEHTKKVRDAMFSTPLTSCSMGVATVAASTFGFAPGYTARTTTVGGAIS